jgi:hypothetical protein
MWTTPSLFKTLTNFILPKFEELTTLGVPTIESHVWSTDDAHIVCGQLTKLTSEQQLLQFILYMKHDNVVMFDAFMWNWNKSNVCDDAIFIASCISEALSNEIQWPIIEERA